MNIKAIIFDADNTLWKRDLAFYNTIKKTVKEMNYQMPTDELITDVNRKNLQFESVFEVLFPGKGTEALAAYRKYAPDEKYQATPHGLSVISGLYEKGLILGIVTNRSKLLSQRMLEAGYQENQFSFKFDPPSPEKKKPHPEAYDPAYAYLASKGISPEEAIVVGDHVEDYLPIKGRYKFVAVTTGSMHKEDFLKAGLEAKFILPDLSGLPALLQTF